MKPVEEAKPVEEITTANVKPETSIPLVATSTKVTKAKSARIEASKLRRRKMGTGVGPEIPGAEPSAVKTGAKSKPTRQHSSQNQSRYKKVLNQ